MPHGKNRLLAAFGEDLGLARPYLKQVRIKAGQVLTEPGEHIDRVYFPHGGLVSMSTPLEDGSLTACTVIGREGAVGALCALGLGTSLTHDAAHVETQASVIDAARLYELVHRSTLIHDAMENYLLAIIGQGVRNSACIARHSSEQRVARWLLTMGAMLESREVKLDQATLGDIVGAQRSSVNPVLQRLRSLELIEVERSCVVIRDREGLKLRACECYEALKPVLIRAMRPDLAYDGPGLAVRKLKRA